MAEKSKKNFNFDNNRFNEYLKMFQSQRSLIEETNVSMEQIISYLSSVSGISEGAIWHWKKGHNKPQDDEKVCAIAEAMGIKPEELESDDTNEKDIINPYPGFIARTPKQIYKRRNGLDTYESIDISKINTNIVNEIYQEISEYIESYRINNDKLSVNELSNKFNLTYRNFKKHRLNLPRIVFDALDNLMTDFLYLMTGFDKALPQYIEELFSDSDRFYDLIDSPGTVSRGNIWNSEITPEIWNEYLCLNKYVMNCIQNDIVYHDTKKRAFITSDFKTDQYLSSYEAASSLILGLFDWIDCQSFADDYYSYNRKDYFLKNINQCKEAIIRLAYELLDQIFYPFIDQYQIIDWPNVLWLDYPEK